MEKLEIALTPKSCQKEIIFALSESPQDQRFVLKSFDESLCYELELKDEKNPNDEEQQNLGHQQQTFVFKDVTMSDFSETEEDVKDRLFQLYLNWLHNSQGGFDTSTEDLDQPIKGLDYSPASIIVRNEPISIRQLITMIDDGDIELNPSFQRNFIWDNTKRSRLIESVLMGLPLPAIYLSQYDDGRLTIVDGLQRIHTINSFAKGSLSLCNLEYLKDCDDHKISDIQEVISPLLYRRFWQTSIMCFVIDYRSPQTLKYDIFKRLNTGGVQLNAQEIRNCLSRKPLQQTLLDMIDKERKSYFDIATENGVRNDRMDAQELALRFIYFYEHYQEGENPTGTYNGYLEGALNKFVDVLNKRPEKELQQYVELFNEALRKAHALFGRYTFRKVYHNYKDHVRRRINKSLLITITVLLAKYREVYVNNNKQVLTQLAELTSTNADFNNALTWSTASKNNMNLVFTKVKEIFDNLLK